MRSVQKRQMMPATEVSVIIPLNGEAGGVRNVLNSLLLQSYPPQEVIVAHDESADDQCLKTLALYGDKLTAIGVKGKCTCSALIRAGLEKSSGQLVTWAYKDQQWPVNELANLVDAWQREGKQLLAAYDFDAFMSKEAQKAKYDWVDALAVSEVSVVDAAPILTTRDALDAVGDLDESLNSAQDIEFLMRAEKRHISIAYVDSRVRQHHADMMEEAIAELDVVKGRYLRRLKPNAFLQYLHALPQTPENYLHRCIELDHPWRYGASNELLARASKRLSGKFLLTPIEQIGVRLSACEHLSHASHYLDDPRPTIVFYVNVWRFGGIERVLSLLLESLQQQYCMLLISTASSNPKDNDEGFAIPDQVLHLKLKPKAAMPIDQQIAYLCSCFHASAFFGTANIVESFLSVYPRLKRMHVKTVASNHYAYYLPYQVSWEWLSAVANLREQYLKDADLITWPTDFSAYCCSQTMPQTIAVPNPNTFSMPESVKLPQTQKILVVGRFYDIIKRVDRTLMTFKHVYALNPAARLVMVGEMRDDMIFPLTKGKRLRDWIAEEQIPMHAIEFVGEQQDVRPYYEDASVLLLTSESEGFGMVLTEAGVYGVPAVVYDYPGCDFVVADGVNGYVIKPNDFEEGARKIVSILQTPSLRQEMSLHARALAGRFTNEKVVKQYEKAIQILLDATSSAQMQEMLEEAGLLDYRQKEKKYDKQRIAFLEWALMQRIKQEDVL